MKSKLIGNKAFYKMVLMLVIPIVIQQGITNFVSLIDNIMVGRLGTEAIAGVAIGNQLMFVFNISIFGGISGASILGAQYFGRGDMEGVKYTFRFKIIISMIVLAIAMIIFSTMGTTLLQAFINEGSKQGDLALTLKNGTNYLHIMMVGLLPFVLSQCYSSTLRDTGETVTPMIASIIAVVLNFVLNGILIFGLFGAPKLGVVGAAIATVISRYAELLYMLFKTYTNLHKFTFFQGALKSLRIPLPVTKKVMLTSWPLLVNEFLWSFGQTVLNQNYSLRGLDVVSAFAISNTVGNLFFIVCMAMGSAISILVGQQLGAGKIEEAKQTDYQLLFFSVCIHVVIGLVLASVAGLIPKVYVTTAGARKLATKFLYVYAASLPLNAFNHGSYFTLRSGGKTFVTFLFDSVSTWVVSIPLAYVLVNYTKLHIVLIYFIVSYADLVKAIIGFFMVKSGVWARKIVHMEDEATA